MIGAYPPLYVLGTDVSAPSRPGLSLVSSGDGTATLRYAPPSDGDYASGEIEYDSGAGVTTYVTTGVEDVVFSLTNGVQYIFTARAQDSSGNWSARSPAVVVTPEAAAPDEPEAQSPGLSVWRDHEIFDYPVGSGAVTYRRRITATVNAGGIREATYRDIAIAHALKERAPIHDTFLSGVQDRLIDTPWTIPARELVLDGARIIPNMDDEIVDADGVKYVITVVEHMTMVARHRVTTRRR